MLPLNRSVSENETVQICAEITAGLLGCNITVPLVVEEGSALGENVGKNSNFMLITTRLVTEVTYSWKSLLELNLGVGPKIIIAKLLVNLNLMVQYGIAIRMYANKEVWQILI